MWVLYEESFKFRHTLKPGMVNMFIEKATQPTQELFVIPVTLYSVILGWVVKMLQALT